MGTIGPGPSRIISNIICQICRRRKQIPSPRTFTTTGRQRAENVTPFSPFGGSEVTRKRFNDGPLQPDEAKKTFGNMLDASNDQDVTSIFSDSFGARFNTDTDAKTKPHRLHVYATKHNTHITFVQPPKPATQMPNARISGSSSKATQQNRMVDMVMSLSTGNIGFRKAGRGTYDAAYQLAAFFLKQLNEKGFVRDIRKLEVVLRGFGAGREAVTKALLGTEGRQVKSKITAVIDATRLKQGGPRSPKPRRLG